MKDFDRNSLSEFDGREGRPAHVAVGDQVIDVSDSRLWKTGLHMKRHSAGTDLTADLQAAPHGREVLDHFPQVGTFHREEDPRIPEVLSRLLRKFPILRRHPHPMTVHFPIVFLSFAPVFTLLYLATGHAPFETTAFHCLGAGILFALAAILTGLYTWWLNYATKPALPIKVKLTMSPILLVVATTAFIWRFNMPEILTPLQGGGYFYLLLVLLLFPLVVVIGWFGAKLTFPTEE